MKLTRENLKAAATSECGWNSAQLEILGVTSFKKGWLSALVGKEIPDKDYATILSLKGVKTKRQRRAITCPELF